MAKASGASRSYILRQTSEIFFKRSKVEAYGSEYAFGKMIETEDESTDFVDRVLNLSMKAVITDPMGADIFTYNILGLSPLDLLKLDYATFVSIEDKINDMEQKYIEKQKNRIKNFDNKEP